MQHAMRWSLLALALGSGACALVADIREGKPRPDIGTGGGGTGGMGGEAGMGGDGGNAMVPACQPNDNIILAVEKLFLGSTDPDGAANPTNAWKQYGANIDGLISTKDSTDLCQPVAGGSKAEIYPDGNDGIDNSFGKNVLPILFGLASDFEATSQEAIQNGHHTYILSLLSLGPQVSCSTTSFLYMGASLGSVPKFDGTDVWPLDPSSLTMQGTPKNVFLKSTIKNNLYDSGPEATFDLVLSLSGFYVSIPIRKARFQMRLGADHQRATEGQISGIILVEDLVSQFFKLAAAFDTQFCDQNNPASMSIANQMRQAADIMADGTQDPQQECNAISIGLGFTMKAVQLGPEAMPQNPPKDPCTCLQSCASAAMLPPDDPSVIFCNTMAGTNAQTLHGALKDCACNGVCKSSCSSAWCMGVPSIPCQNCLQSAAPNGCQAEYFACTN